MANLFDLFKQIRQQDDATKAPIEYLIVGLGNPGKEYEFTRHNAGFLALDQLAEKSGAAVKKIKFKSLTGEAVVGSRRCLLMKPSTYMNNSGEAVVEAMNFYKIPIENVLVLYDDISLEPGKLRIRRKGSDGGHNGIKSIIYLTGKDTFPRIKLGVGKKPDPRYDLAKWVLSAFSKEEFEAMEQAFSNAGKAAALIVDGKIDQAMNLYNA